MIKFVSTRYLYDSYSDFRSLVRLSRFATCFVDEVRLDEPSIYIVTPANGEWRPHIANERQRVQEGQRRAVLVWWNLERGWNPGEAAPSSDGLGDMLQWCDRVWISDRSWARALATIHGQDRIRNVPVGSHPKLAEEPWFVPEYKHDLIHLSYVTHRRSLVYDRLAKTLRIAPNCWGAERHLALKGSRVLLGIHQDDKPIIEPLRFALAAAYGIPILTETVNDPWPYIEGESILTFPYATAVESVCGFLARSSRDLQGIGLAARKLMAEKNTFRSFVEQEVATYGLS